MAEGEIKSYFSPWTKSFFCAVGILWIVNYDIYYNCVYIFVEELMHMLSMSIRNFKIINLYL
jgi:hypothetical protein